MEIEIEYYVWLPTIVHPIGAVGMGYCYSAEEAEEYLQGVRWRAMQERRPLPQLYIRVGAITTSGEFVEFPK